MNLGISPLAGVLLACAVFAPGAAAQDVPTKYEAPRTSFGQPDLQGVWSNATMTPMIRKAGFGTRLTYTEQEVEQLENRAQLEIKLGNASTDPNAPADVKLDLSAQRPEFTAAGGAVGGYNRGWLDPGNYVMRVNGEPRTSLITTPNGQTPPRRASAAPMPAPFGGSGGEDDDGPLGSFDSYETRSLGERCIIGFGRNGGPPMFPNGFYNNNYQIVQTPDAILIEIEMVHDVRIIRLNAKHRNDAVRPFFGDSIGWWDGGTLVIETTHIPEAQAFMGAWKELKVTERLTRVGADRLSYKFEVDDPTVWEQPWGGEYEFSPMKNSLYEYACHEGNYALDGILKGARIQEDKASRAKNATSGKPEKSKQ